MRLCRLPLLLAMPLVGCSDLIGSDDALEYRGPISGSFAEVFTYTDGAGRPLQCTIHSLLSGTVRVRLQKAGDVRGADAGVDLTERVIGASPARQCSSSREVRPFGEWTAEVQGTGSQLSFTMSRSSSNQTATIRFDGALAADVITGTLTYSRTTTGQAGPATGTSEFPVRIQLRPASPTTVSGTWTGALTVGLDGNSTVRETRLILAQNENKVTGQLHFAGGEVVSVEGTLDGAALSIRATPNPAGDQCHLYSFGLAFVQEGGQLRPTSATGTACFDGGATLRSYTSVSGALTRS